MNLKAGKCTLAKLNDRPFAVQFLQVGPAVGGLHAIKLPLVNCRSLWYFDCPPNRPPGRDRVTVYYVVLRLAGFADRDSVPLAVHAMTARLRLRSGTRILMPKRASELAD